MQDSILFDFFTVNEALNFAASLRLTQGKAEIDKRVLKIVNLLGLQKVRFTRIGSVFNKTLSGGEKKRLSIGIELVTDPSLIVLDEPTSGLDSANALNLYKTLHDFAHEHGKTVIGAVH